MSDIETIKSNIDIVNVVGETINLTNTGNGIFTGAISSSSKSGSSLRVDSNLQLYNDFASGDGGDVLNWVAFANNLDIKTDFRSVLKIAADIAGVKLDNNNGDSSNAEHKNNLETLMTAIAEYYHNNLLPEHRVQIVEQWGISDETINRLHIGFASRGNQLIDTFKDLFSEDLLYETGIILKFENSHKDLFNGRIIFPYWKNGKVLYFIGRHTEWTPDSNYEKSKYIKQLVHNNKHPYVSEYISNQYFYGEDTIREVDEVLITEGVTDCIMAMQSNIPCISPVTTNIKRVELDRAHSLVSNARKVIICNDTETNESGKKGAMATAEFLISKGMDVRLVELPVKRENDKIDLAEYLRDNPKETYIELAKTAKTLYRVRLDKIEVDTDQAVAIEAAIYFVNTELKDQSIAYQNTFIETHIKDQFNFTASQVKDVKATITKKTKSSTKPKTVPLSKDKQKEDAKHHNGIDVPKPYCLRTVYGDTGTFRHSTIEDSESHMDKDVYDLVCHNPTWLENAFVDPLTKKHYLELMFEYRQNKVSRIVSQKDILTVNGLKELTAMGLNVPESCTKALSEYYGTFIKKSTTLTEKNIYSKFGWSNDDNSFIIGDKVISADSDTTAYLTNDVQVDTIQSFACVGTSEGWFGDVGGLLQYDNVRFVCYAAASTLILKILNGASYVVELVGFSSTGKTYATELAMSMYGNPESLKLATSTTLVFLERMCSTCNDLPIFLDETSMIKPEILKEMTYMISNERGKGRGKKEGGVNTVDKWKSVALTTGEVPLTNNTSLGGQNVRLVSLYGGIGAYDPDNVQHFKDNKLNNCGTIAPLLIKKILNEKDNLQSQYNQIRDVFNKYSKADKSGIMGRIVDTYALIALSGIIFESIIEDIGGSTMNAIDVVEKKFCDKMTHSDGSLSDRAFAIVSDWVVENRRCFCYNRDGDAGERSPLYGNISMEHNDGVPYDYVDIIPTKLYEVLDSKFDHPGLSNQIILGWANEDKLVKDKEGKNQVRATIKAGDKQLRVVRLKMPLISEKGEEEYDF